METKYKFHEALLSELSYKEQKKFHAHLALRLFKKLHSGDGR